MGARRRTPRPPEHIVFAHDKLYRPDSSVGPPKNFLAVANSNPKTQNSHSFVGSAFFSDCETKLKKNIVVQKRKKKELGALEFAYATANHHIFLERTGPGARKKKRETRARENRDGEKKLAGDAPPPTARQDASAERGRG
jgi:hypothetical protein